MTAPRLDIDLEKVRHNCRTLVDRLAPKGIDVTGVTKAFLGASEMAQAMLDGGATSLGDSRIENLQAMRGFSVEAPMRLIRSPMLSQVDAVVELVEISFNTESSVISALSLSAAQHGIVHGVVIMVELGDLREGVMPDDLSTLVALVMSLPNVRLAGLGTNLACQTGVIPDVAKMDELSRLSDSVEVEFGIDIEMITGGNSANLSWALSGVDTGRINNLRLGESILLGRDPLHRQAIDGLHTDAITLVAEVIEAKDKPAMPWGDVAEAAFSGQPERTGDGTIHQAILAVGRQDIDPDGLTSPTGIDVLGASSDHLVVRTMPDAISVGQEVSFELNYSALVRAMTSPFVERTYTEHPVLAVAP